jgi:hypothetical protein
MRTWLRMILLQLCLLWVLPLQAQAEPRLEILRHRQDQAKLRFFVKYVNEDGTIPLVQPKPERLTIETGMGGITPRTVEGLLKHSKGLTTVMMVDQSGSMGQFQDHLRTAAIEFVDTMRQEDRVALFFFGEQDQQYDFDRDAGVLRTRLNEHLSSRPSPSTKTRLYNFLVDAIKKAAASGADFPVVLILSDGVDTGGAFSASDISKIARENGVGVYALGFVDRNASNYKQLENLKALAHATEGWYEEVTYERARTSGELGRRFIQARKRLDGLLVVSAELCGMARADLASRPENTYQFKYGGVLSPQYTAPVDAVSADLKACPDCPYGKDESCAGNQRCDNEYCTDVVCKPFEKAADHACAEIKCSAQGDCPSGTRCAETGVCATPCPKCQVIDKSGACVPASCANDCFCGDGCQCRSGGCYAVDDVAEKTKCKGCEFPVDGRCQALPCQNDADCQASCDGAAGSCVCREVKEPSGGPAHKLCVQDPTKSAEACAALCQDVYLGACEAHGCSTDDDCSDHCRCDAAKKACVVAPEPTCEACQQHNHGQCFNPKCKDDSECGEECFCNAETGQCKLGNFCQQDPTTCYVIGGAGFLILLILIIIIIMVRRRRTPEPDPEDLDSNESDDDPDGGTVIETDVNSGTVIETGIVLLVDWSGQRYLEYPVSTDTISAGADAVCALHLDIPTVSSRHATFQYRNGILSVRDDGSTNGTFVNESKLNEGIEVPLQPGQVVRLGSAVTIEISSGNDGPGAPVFKGTVIDR